MLTLVALCIAPCVTPALFPDDDDAEDDPENKYGEDTEEAKELDRIIRVRLDASRFALAFFASLTLRLRSFAIITETQRLSGERKYDQEST